MEQMSL